MRIKTRRLSLKLNYILLLISISILISISLLTLNCLEEKPQLKNPDVLIDLSIADAITLDPADAYEASSINIIQNIYDRLVTYNGSDISKVTPMVAESWNVSEDGLKYTFKIRKGIKFTNGNPLNASAVKFSIDRAIIMNRPPAMKLIELVDSTRVIDDYTFEIKLKRAYPAFLKLLAFSVASIVDPEVVNAHGGVKANEINEFMASNAIGSGPYKLVSWERGQQIVLEANEDYWRGKPKIKRYIYKIVPEPATQMMILEKGDADLAYIPLANLKELENKSGIVVESGGLSLQIDFIVFNNNLKPFDSKLVRQAICYAFDYKAAIKNVYYNQAEIARGPIPMGMFGHDDSLEWYTRDLARAKALLKQAGYENFTAEIIYLEGNDEMRKTAILLQDNLREIGIELKIQPLAYSAYISKIFNKDFQLALAGWAPDFPDPDGNVAFLLHPNSEVNYASYSNPVVTELIEEGARELNETTRLQIYSKIQRLVKEDAPYLWIAQYKIVGVYRTWVKGYYYNPVTTASGMRDLFALSKE
ncbi:MAG: ABC transporter substrate-binding protein [Methanocellales archaeon]